MDRWAAATDHRKGAVLEPETLWQLARRWYDDRLELDWCRRTIPERQAILDQLGLIGDFWDLSAGSGSSRD